VKADLLTAAKVKVANPDVTRAICEFRSDFFAGSGIEAAERYFFIEGGALAVENALKAAMDWKVRKNLGRRQR